MSATRLLLRPNKAAIGWAVLARSNGTVPALPSCSPFPYCAALAPRNGTAPAIPSCSPFPYRHGNGTASALLSVGPRHMSSDGRRASLLDRIALQLEAEGIPYSKSLDKFINKILDDKIQPDVQSSQEHRVTMLKLENEKLIRDIEKMHMEFRCEIDKAAARRLELNLERGRIREKLAKHHAEITDLVTKLDQEIHTLAQWERQNTR